MKTEETTTKQLPTSWGVYYMPNKEGRIFAGLKPELQYSFTTQDEALASCKDLSQTGGLDELHSGYDVKPLFD
jgi:hypothetical protein